MTDLKFAVQEEGYKVVHIKTDSIKIADADDYIVDFVHKMGEAYGYTFETEAIFDKICLVNDAVFIAKVRDGDWTATGKQFAVPYVFKTLFSKESILFKDMCETKSVATALYLDMNEGLLKMGKEDEHNYIFVGKVGQFTPIQKGKGGGILLREKDGKYYAANDSKGYRWLESETVSKLKKTKDIDKSYYDAMVNDAVETISKYGSIDWLTA